MTCVNVGSASTGKSAGQRTPWNANPVSLRDHLLAICGTGIVPPELSLSGLVSALLLMGLTGGVTHCAGMCGSFVLAQVGSRLGRVAASDFGPWTRCAVAALAPYHLGRMTTYTVLGAVAGGVGSVFARWTAFKPLLSVFLLAAAALFLMQLAAEFLPALRGGAAAGRMGRLAHRLSRIAAPLFADPRGWRGYLLGGTLGFLPCGLIYGGLAAAAGSGSALAGALAMAALVAGTVPGLVAVGYGGAALGLRWRQAMRPVARSLMAINAAVLIWIALGSIV